jgi:hypothetical protein
MALLIIRLVLAVVVALIARRIGYLTTDVEALVFLFAVLGVCAVIDATKWLADRVNW